jgi:Fur family ferric uptake transcriptional regulator
MLKLAGLRRTPVRLGVLRVLARSTEPLAVPAILERLPEHTDAVTVYRTLNSFTRKRLVHRVRGEDRTWRYALSHATSAPAHQHPHFVCEQCGRVECIEQANIPDRFVKSLGLDERYLVSYAEVLLHGRCPRCRT